MYIQYYINSYLNSLVAVFFSVSNMLLIPVVLIYVSSSIFKYSYTKWAGKCNKGFNWQLILLGKPQFDVCSLTFGKSKKLVTSNIPLIYWLLVKQLKHNRHLCTLCMPKPTQPDSFSIVTSVRHI